MRAGIFSFYGLLVVSGGYYLFRAPSGLAEFSTNTSVPPAEAVAVVQPSHELAFNQSFGFFDDITDEAWINMYQARARKTYPWSSKAPHKEAPPMFYLHNLEPTFTCPHVRRVGGLGDGPKWTCDPHRIPRVAAEREQQGKPCLIYSVGSAGRFDFEFGILKKIGSICEIHIFDPRDYIQPWMAKRNVFFHAWGMNSSYDTRYEPPVKGEFVSLQETMKRLGHEGRTIDIFKIDCENCEWYNYKDWFSVDMRQILVETHGIPDPATHGKLATDFFDAFAEHNYVMFSKEVNIHPRAHNQCVEFSYIKLDQEFLHPS